MDTQLELVWSGALTFALTLCAWLLRSYVDQIRKLQTLLSQTREEMAKDYITKSEVNNHITRVMDRLDALDAKIDRLIENYPR